MLRLQSRTIRLTSRSWKILVVPCFLMSVFPETEPRVVPLVMIQPKAFIDWRDNGVNKSASMGVTSSHLEIAMLPPVPMPPRRRPSINEEGEYVGGLFWDGREPDLEGQAGGPFLNPIEMQMPDKASVIARLQEHTLFMACIQIAFW